MTRKSPISSADRRQLGPEQADRHTGWNFPITQAWKDIRLLFFKTEKEYRVPVVKHITVCFH